jgi:hypothetical protein
MTTNAASRVSDLLSPTLHYTIRSALRIVTESTGAVWRRAKCSCSENLFICDMHVAHRSTGEEEGGGDLVAGTSGVVR